MPGIAAASAYALVLRPWLLRWGASPDEASQPLPGDGLIPHPILETTRAITIHAAAADIWPWLVQIGQGRGGFYSYDALENLLGMDIHNAGRILPEYQALKIGDVVPFWQGAGVKVIALEPERCLALAGRLNEGEATGCGQPQAAVGGSWVFALQKKDSRTTRLVVRSRVASFPPYWLSLLFMRLLLEPAHFIMERRMLIGIKERVEGVVRSK
jgi:hypothetical protein